MWRRKAPGLPAREPQPFDRWIDPAIAYCPEQGPRATARLQADLAEMRDAAIAKFGPLIEPPPDTSWVTFEKGPL